MAAQFHSICNTDADTIDEKLKDIVLSSSEFACVQALLLYIKSQKCSSLYIGGDGNSDKMLQVQAESNENGAVDILAMVLVSQVGTVEPMTMARRAAALNLIGLFWKAWPEAPVVIEYATNEYGHVLCGIQETPESWNAFTLSHWTHLETHYNDKVTFLSPHPREEMSQDVSLTANYENEYNHVSATSSWKNSRANKWWTHRHQSSFSSPRKLRKH